MAVISVQTSKLETYEEQISNWIVQEMSTDIFHKNREISTLMMKKKQQGWHFLRKPQKELN